MGHGWSALSPDVTRKGGAPQREPPRQAGRPLAESDPGVVQARFPVFSRGTWGPESTDDLTPARSTRRGCRSYGALGGELLGSDCGGRILPVRLARCCMAKKAKVSFDPKLFLANVDGGSAVSKYRKKQTVWRVVKCKRAAEAALIAGFADQSHMSGPLCDNLGSRYQAALA
jgi:hypothetical protein